MFVKQLSNFLKAIDKDYDENGNVMFYLEALKNQFIGKIHYPHGHMIDKGI